MKSNKRCRALETPKTDMPIQKEEDKKSSKKSKLSNLIELKKLDSIHYQSPNTVIYRLDAIEFLKSLPDSSIDLLITDPAYSSMNNHLQLGRGRIVGEYKNRGKEGKWFEEFEDSVENYSLFLSEASRVLKENSHIYVMLDSFSLLNLGPLFKDYFNVKNILVWDKVNMGMGHYFRRQVEFVIFCTKGKLKLTRKNFRDIWRVKRINTNYPSQKPVKIFENMIKASKPRRSKNYVVCDPFLGAGSAAIASLKSKALFIGADISIKAMNKSTQRIEAFEFSKIDPGEKSKKRKSNKKKASKKKPTNPEKTSKNQKKLD